MSVDTKLTQQLDEIVKELRRVADRMEENSVNDSSVRFSTENLTSKVEDEADFASEVVNEVGENIVNEAGTILQSAIDQFSGNRPADMDPDQLYGWTDSLQKVIGNKSSAPNSEIRKLEDMVTELGEVLRQR